MKNTFLKRFSSLQNKKTHFWSVFIFTKWKKTSVWSVLILTKWKTHKLLKCCSSLQSKKHVFKHFQVYNMKKTSFWSVFQVWKNKKHVFEAFQDYKTKKTRFWRVFKFTKWKKSTLLNRFSLLQHENAHFWSDCEFFHWARNRIRVSAPFSVFTQKKNPKIELLCYLKTLPPYKSMKVKLRFAILGFEIGRIIYPIFNECSWKASKSDSDRFVVQIFD